MIISDEVRFSWADGRHRLRCRHSLILECNLCFEWENIIWNNDAQRDQVLSEAGVVLTYPKEALVNELLRYCKDGQPIWRCTHCPSKTICAHSLGGRRLADCQVCLSLLEKAIRGPFGMQLLSRTQPVSKKPYLIDSNYSVSPGLAEDYDFSAFSSEMEDDSQKPK